MTLTGENRSAQGKNCLSAILLTTNPAWTNPGIRVSAVGGRRLTALMDHQWNDIDRRKPKYSGKNLSQCHFVNHKFHMNWPGIEPGPPRWEAGD
jgi:hypothetical protein